MKKKLNLLVEMILVGSFSSCKHKTSHLISTYVENKSGYTLNLQYYNDGTVINEFTVYNNSSHKVGVQGDAGKVKGNGNGGYLNQLSDLDSAVATFNSKYFLVYYQKSIKVNNPIAIKYNNTRNFFNNVSYEEVISENNDKKFVADYIYTFTPLDYLDAKHIKL